MTKCQKCNGFNFEIEEVSPIGSRYKMYFIQCIHCKAPVGVTDYFNTADLIDKIEKKIEGMESTLSGIEHQIRILKNR